MISRGPMDPGGQSIEAYRKRGSKLPIAAIGGIILVYPLRFARGTRVTQLCDVCGAQPHGITVLEETPQADRRLLPWRSGARSAVNSMCEGRTGRWRTS